MSYGAILGEKIANTIEDIKNEISEKKRLTIADNKV